MAATACAVLGAHAAAAPTDSSYPTKPIRGEELRKTIPVEITKWTKVAIAAGMQRE